MKLFDRRGRVRERALTLLTLRGRGKPGRAGHGPRRRPPADPLHLSERHPRHRASSSGSTRTQTTSASSTCRRSAACAASPAPRRRRASSAATSPTRTSAAASSTTTPTPCSTRHAVVDRAGRRGPARLPARVAPQGRVRRVPARRLARPQGQLRRRPGRHLQPAQREAEGLHRPAARAGRGHLDRRWTSEMTNALEKTRTELVDREGRTTTSG